MHRGGDNNSCSPLHPGWHTLPLIEGGNMYSSYEYLIGAVDLFFVIKLDEDKLNVDLLQSIWVSMRGSSKEFDEAKLRFAAAEVLNFYFGYV